MAGSHTLNDPFVSRAPQRKGRRLALGVTLATGAVLALTPMAVMALVPDTAESATPAIEAPETTLAAFTGRAVEVDGSVMGFRQQGDVINVAVNPSDYGQRVFVQNRAGDLIEFHVPPGQSHLTATLPAAFAAAEELTIRID